MAIKHEKCSPSLVIRKMKLTLHTNQNAIVKTIIIGEDVDKAELSFTTGEKVN